MSFTPRLAFTSYITLKTLLASKSGFVFPSFSGNLKMFLFKDSLPDYFSPAAIRSLFAFPFICMFLFLLPRQIENQLKCQKHSFFPFWILRRHAWYSFPTGFQSLFGTSYHTKRNQSTDWFVRVICVVNMQDAGDFLSVICTLGGSGLSCIKMFWCMGAVQLATVTYCGGPRVLEADR